MILQHCQLEENPSRLLFLKKLMVVTYFTSYLLFLEIYCNSYIFILSAVLYLTLPGIDYTLVVFVIILPFNDRHSMYFSIHAYFLPFIDVPLSEVGSKTPKKFQHIVLWYGIKAKGKVHFR